MFGIKKFHKYLFVLKFVLITDDEHFKFIIGQNKGIPVSVAARITRWVITFSGYHYFIEYTKGTAIPNADGFSRLPIQNSTEIDDCILSFNLVN